jgi:hypothetical protein
MELLSRMPEMEFAVKSGTCDTPFYAASHSGQLEVVKIFLESGVTVNFGMRGESPLEVQRWRVMMRSLNCSKNMEQ